MGSREPEGFSHRVRNLGSHHPRRDLRAAPTGGDDAGGGARGLGAGTGRDRRGAAVHGCVGGCSGGGGGGGGEGEASTPTAAADEVVAEAGEVTCSEITYTPASASGAQLGTLCTPSVVTSHTTVLLVHGGGGYQGSRADLAAWQEVYADAGVPTLAIDYTLTGDRGEAAIYPLAEQNVKAAVEYLRLVGADLGTDRVVVQGHSAGARLGAIVLTTPDDPSFAGPELRAGVSDAIDGFIGFYGYYGGDQFEAEAYYGSASRQAADAVTNAGRATGPTVLVHGIDDGFVPVQHSRRLAEALQAAGPGGELDLVADAGHGFDGYAQAELTEAGRRSADHLLAWLSRH